MNISQQSQKLKKILSSGSHIRIVSHRNPDGDALGSMVAFAYICKYFNISYELFISDLIPITLSFFTKNFVFNFFDPEKENSAFELINEHTDVIAFLDCGQINRAGSISNTVLPHQTLINIDHHMSNTLFGDFNCVEDISSTCELLYLFIKEYIPITSTIAEALYIGVLTDTGMFQFEKVTPYTHMMIADLMEFSIDHVKIYQTIYQNYPISWISLIQKGLEKLELYHNNSLALMSFSLGDIDEEQEGFDDTHALFPIMLSTQSIQICAIIKEKEDGIISASLRSKGMINVSEIAQFFGGGGHINAAGCRSSQHSFSEFKSLLLEIISKTLKYS